MGAIYRKYFRSAVRYFIVFLFLPVVFILARAAVDVIYAAINEISPNLIPSYSRIFEKEKYEAVMRTVNGVTAIVSVFILGFATAIYDNARFEDLIARTDGLFKIPEELPRYFKRNFPSDVIAAALPPAIFVPLTLPEYSEKFLEYFGILISPHLCIAAFLPPVGAYFALFGAALFGRILAMPKALSRHRSIWLASFVDS